MGKPNGLDDIDVILIELLQADGTLSLEALRSGLLERRQARDIGNISRRVKRLKDEGFIAIRAVPDLDRLGFADIRIVQIQFARIANKTVDEIIEEFEDEVRKNVPSATEGYKTTGNSDYVLIIPSRDAQHFSDAHSKITKIRSVGKIVTLCVMSRFSKSLPVHLP